MTLVATALKRFTPLVLSLQVIKSLGFCKLDAEKCDTQCQRMAYTCSVTIGADFCMCGERPVDMTDAVHSCSGSDIGIRCIPDDGSLFLLQVGSSPFLLPSSLWSLTHRVGSFKSNLSFWLNESRREYILASGKSTLVFTLVWCYTFTLVQRFK